MKLLTLKITSFDKPVCRCGSHTLVCTKPARCSRGHFARHLYVAK